jgi:hypothetical protein
MHAEYIRFYEAMSLGHEGDDIFQSSVFCKVELIDCIFLSLPIGILRSITGHVVWEVGAT